MRRLREIALVLAFGPGLCGFGLLEKRDPEIEAGNAALKAGKADEALGHYDQAVKKLPGDPGAHFDRGAALYALSRFDEAGQEFLRATEAKDPALKASAFYNLGNAYFKKEKFKDAVSAYTRTLGLKPGDKQAKWNLEIALRKQKDEQDKKDKKDQDKKDQDKKDQDKKDKQQDKKDQKDKDKQQDKKDQKDKDKQQDKKDQDKKDQSQNDQQKQPQPSKPEEDKQIQSVLDNLERSQKDLEKERARARAVRRAPPERDW
ncbi:MAG TPA: tetratricopeptide repeat protein [Polyangia bacterium]|nr:tetratricopeptide repeat protein [Polyangia bacterium]